MTKVSLRTFSRNAQLRKKAARGKEKLLIESREKNGETIIFMVTPAPKELVKTSKELKSQQADLGPFVGCWHNGKKPPSIKEEKEIMRKLWTKS